MSETPRSGSLFRGLRTSLDVFASIAMIAVGVYFFFPGILGSTPSEPESLAARLMPLNASFVEGNSTARRAMIVFTDFQCPFCARFAEQTLPAIRRDYVEPGQLRLAIRHLPLEAIHPDARWAAAAAICSSLQGAFWPLHDRLFASPRRLKEYDLEEHASAAGLDSGALRDCMAAPATQQAISDDLALASRLGIRSTPTIVIGHVDADGQVAIRRHFSGAISAPALSRALNELGD